MPTAAKRPIRRIFPAAGIGLAALAAIAILAGWLPGIGGPASRPVAIGGPFTLTDGAGRTVTDRSFRGKYMLVYFGYTFCPDVCPTTLTEVADALDKLGARADQVQPLFITVDPARDTAPVVGQYAAAFSPRLDGLTGSAEQVAAVAKEYRVYYAPHRTGPNPADYTMDHSSILYVMDPQGRFDGIIRADEGADAMAADLSKFVGGAGS